MGLATTRAPHLALDRHEVDHGNAVGGEVLLLPVLVLQRAQRPRAGLHLDAELALHLQPHVVCQAITDISCIVIGAHKVALCSSPAARAVARQRAV